MEQDTFYLLAVMGNTNKIILNTRDFSDFGACNVAYLKEVPSTVSGLFENTKKTMCYFLLTCLKN